MTTETLIQKVREEVGELDERSRQLLATAMKIIQKMDTATNSPPTEKGFLGRNISLQEYEALPPHEKLRYQDEAEELNQDWTQKQLLAQNAKWLMVADGQVVSHGKDLDDYPEDEDFFKLCEMLGKYPFIFFSPAVFAIEENATQWHVTDDPLDAYPALPMKISENGNDLEIEADLDTGAVECYCSAELLIKHNVIRPDAKRFLKTSRHLSQPYIYFSSRLWLELSDKNGVNRRWRTTTICVTDWQHSPFVAINPHRTFLLGRKLLLNLRPRVVLDFDVRQNEIEFKEQISCASPASSFQSNAEHRAALQPSAAIRSEQDALMRFIPHRRGVDGGIAR